eukprot:6179419-Pleurochrysis_carterae.AAC.4
MSMPEGTVTADTPKVSSPSFGNSVDRPSVLWGQETHALLPEGPSSHVEFLTSSCWRASREGDSSGAPTLPAPEGVVIADIPSVSSWLPPTRLFARLPFNALGSGVPRTLARRPEHAASFTFSWRASREGDSSGAPTLPAPEGSRHSLSVVFVAGGVVPSPVHSLRGLYENIDTLSVAVPS